MPSGLVALLDDIAMIARLAAASLDDVGAAATRAGTKAAGVVIDDAAVTPSYVTRFTPDRELPIIYRITMGSLRNKLVFLLPAALLLSAFLPWAITPLLMLGGLYLSFEGAEKIIERIGGGHHDEAPDEPIGDMAAFERQRVAGAVRTDFILSAEIMAIALAEVADAPLVQRAIILALVGVVITIAVYGAVALIVKMDDIGLHLARRSNAAVQRAGRFLVAAMPGLLSLLASLGTFAMLWVGGGIILHGVETLGLHGPAELAHNVRHAVAHAAGPLGGVLGGVSHALLAALLGMVLGALVAAAVHVLRKLRGWSRTRDL
ncbi:MAG: DUF808 domain-containing protein [Novosphingobium sp.]|jgi:predicted DNA repair protein MutK|nr:DUF808 domain-containing protein [Novosphingobium sp.]